MLGACARAGSPLKRLSTFGRAVSRPSRRRAGTGRRDGAVAAELPRGRAGAGGAASRPSCPAGRFGAWGGGRRLSPRCGWAQGVVGPPAVPPCGAWGRRLCPLAGERRAWGRRLSSLAGGLRACGGGAWRTEGAAVSRWTATAGSPGRGGCGGALVMRAAWGATTASGAPMSSHPARMPAAIAGSEQAALIAAREPGGNAAMGLPGAGAALQRLHAGSEAGRGVHTPKR
eukprot:1986073-Prymnesium_polylepis.1